MHCSVRPPILIDGPHPPQHIANMGVQLTTVRLVLRELDSESEEDCRFMVALLSEPGFRAFIADRGEVSLAEAAKYIERACQSSYLKNGFGMYAVEEASSGRLLGVTGLIRRAGLEDVDLGFAFLEAHSGSGYATEAGEAALRDALNRLQISRVSAITTEANTGSVNVLLKLGFSRSGFVTLPGKTEELVLFLRDLSS